MLNIEALSKPQYLFRPSQIVRRLVRELRGNPNESIVHLPWHLDLAVDPVDTIAHALLAQGVYDLVTTEVLWRLTGAGERTGDIGANVGYMTGLLATRAGSAGSVVAFEPHPKTFAILRQNTETWNALGSLAPISAIHSAVSDHDGVAACAVHWVGDSNASHAFLVDGPQSNSVEVQVCRFVTLLHEGEEFGVVKVDTQGHEHRVFAGMGDALSEKRIRDIVYEEESGYPAPSHAALEKAGYSICAFEERLSGPRIVPPTAMSAPKRSYEVLPSYLATRNVQRAKDLFSVRGWQCLRG